MSDIPEGLRYTDQHEWVASEEGGLVRVGITYYAQDSLGDITFVEMPAVGDVLEKGGVFGVVESVKAASDLYAPLSGEVVEVNTALEASPERINKSPYEEGWILRLRLADPSAMQSLLDASQYAEHTQ